MKMLASHIYSVNFLIAGRISRKQFWLAALPFQLLLWLISLIFYSKVIELTYFLDTADFVWRYGYFIIVPAVFALNLVLYWSYFVVLVKRYHDRNYSMLAVVLSFVLLSTIPIYYEEGGVIDSVIGFIAAGWSIAVFVVAGFSRGTVGDNRYGTDPLVRARGSSGFTAESESPSPQPRSAAARVPAITFPASNQKLGTDVELTPGQADQWLAIRSSRSDIDHVVNSAQLSRTEESALARAMIAKGADIRFADAKAFVDQLSQGAATAVTPWNNVKDVTVPVAPKPFDGVTEWELMKRYRADVGRLVSQLVVSGVEEIELAKKVMSLRPDSRTEGAVAEIARELVLAEDAKIKAELRPFKQVFLNDIHEFLLAADEEEASELKEVVRVVGEANLKPSDVYLGLFGTAGSSTVEAAVGAVAGVAAQYDRLIQLKSTGGASEQAIDEQKVMLREALAGLSGLVPVENITLLSVELDDIYELARRRRELWRTTSRLIMKQRASANNIQDVIAADAPTPTGSQQPQTNPSY